MLKERCAMIKGYIICPKCTLGYCYKCENLKYEIDLCQCKGAFHQ